MIEKELCNMIIEKYYKDVFRFCMSQLNNVQDAEDCTQETFTVFFEKCQKLYLTDGISQWLFNTAVNIIKRHKKNNSVIREDINGESLKIEDNSISGYDPFHIIHKYLSETEAELLLEYNSCESKEERLALANKNNISLGNLAVKITRIKQKLRTEMENDAH